jgi:predicted porin
MSAAEDEHEMKTVLLGTTAVALIGALALPASAAEWNVRVGGFMEQYVGYADIDIDTVSGSVGGVSVGDDFYRRTLGATFLENEGNNDAQRFTYFTPRFSGFKLGVSYARDGLQDTNVQVDEDSTLSNIFDIGADYVNSFGDFDIAVSGRWGIADNDTSADPQVWSAGLNLGFSGFTVGGSYAEQTGASSVRMNGEVWDVGVSYETGPWGLSVTFQHGENVDDENPGFGKELDQFLLGASYRLAEGVALNAFGGYVEFDEDVSVGGGGSGDDIDAWVIGTAVKINF